MSERPTLLVPTGDPAGVGPLIAVEASLAVSERARVVLFGDAERLRALAGARAAQLTFEDVGRVPEGAVLARCPTAEGGVAQLRALDAAIDAAMGQGGDIVTAPVSKAAVHRAGVPAFVGQTERLARRAGLSDDDVTMLFIGPRLKVSLATTHVAISQLPIALAQRRVERAIRHLVEALRRLGSRAPRIGVSGLNPHAGEAGAFGDEDERVIAPAIEACRAEDVTLVGPLGAETVFRWAASKELDGAVAMFHDQATIASKLLDWESAVNTTWGLPFLRTSVDHGVAYDAAARGEVSAKGMRAALELALRLRNNR